MRVLLLPHRFPPHGRGGVETWAWLLRGALAAEGARVGVLTRDDRPAGGAPPFSVVEAVDAQGPVFWLRHRHGDSRTFRDTWGDPRVEDAVARAVRAFRPDVLHVGHADGFGVAPFRVGRRLGVPVVCTLHDPKWLCVRGQMLRPPGTPCRTVDEARCVPCVASQLDAGPVRGLARRLAPGFLSTRLAARDREVAPTGRASTVGTRRWRVRQAALRAALEGASALISPSRFLAERFAELGIRRTIDVCSNGLPSLAPAPLPDGPLRIGWFGTDVPSKGLEVLLAAAEDLPVEVHVHGVCTRPSTERVRMHGPYDGDRVHQLMAAVHAVCIPSTWEENQPYVALEARRAGRPLIAAALGGLPELVRDGVDGWLVAPGDVGSLKRRLRDLLADPGALTEAAGQVLPPPTDAAMARDHLAIYRACTGATVPLASADPDPLGVRD